MPKMKTISEILKSKDSKLKKLLEKTKDSRDLEAIFRTALDDNLAKPVPGFGVVILGC